MGTEVRPIPAKQVPHGAPVSLFSTASSELRFGAVLAAVWLVAAAFALYHLNRGWVALDDGMLAQSALRVFQGQLPHRDFVENYSGGMSYYHALAFRILGTNLVSLRIAVFLAFLASVPATFYIASRLFPPIAAGAVTMLTIAWGFPNYPAAMPSWYNLFLAIFGLAALFRYLEDPKWRWLFLAGVAGGISCLAKITGLYYVAAVLLFFVFHEQSCDRSDQSVGRSSYYRFTILVCLTAFIIAVWLVFGSRRDPADFIHFTVPPTALALLLIWREFNVSAHSSAARFRTLMRLLAPFAIGFAMPITIFIAPYCLSHSTSALVGGVFHAGFAHVAAMGGRLTPPNPILLLLMLPILLGLAISFGRRSRWIFAAVLAVVLAASFKHGMVSRAVWASAGILAPVIVVAGVILLLTTSKPAETPVGLQRTMLLISATAMCSLVQFPFPAPIYLCYFAPVLVLAIAAFVASSGSFRTNGAPAFLLLFYLLFAALRVTTCHIYETWDMSLPPANSPRALNLSRAGGLRVASESADLYEHLIPFLQEHAGSGSMMAIANCAELYFLSGVPNTTQNDYAADDAQIVRAIKSNEAKLFVVNTSQVFTRGDLVASSLRAAITQAFPNEKSFGAFEVFWRP